MGLNIGNNLYAANAAKPIIDTQALTRVAEKIFNPDNQQNVDVSKLDLSKFNRVRLGTDLYAQRTNADVALKVAKAASDFDLNFSKAFTANVQYLNSQAAQSLFTSRENAGKIVIDSNPVAKVDEQQIITAASQISETQEMDKNKKGSNPFSFYYQAEDTTEGEGNDSALSSINIFA